LNVLFCKPTPPNCANFSSGTRLSRLNDAMAEIEAAKKAAALEAVKNHFPSNPRFVGIGSGTTIVYVVEAIKSCGVDVSRVGFVPTGYQSKQLIINAGLIPIEFDALPDDAMIDIAFDGADEVDEEMNCIKGGGACLYQEKLVAMRAKQFVCVAGTFLLLGCFFFARPSC
jgi:ribose 5-phosphate isomerase A